MKPTGDRLFSNNCIFIFDDEPQKAWVIDQIIYCQTGDKEENRCLKYIKIGVTRKKNKKTTDEFPGFDILIIFNGGIRTVDFINPVQEKFVYKNISVTNPFNVEFYRDSENKVDRIRIVRENLTSN